MQISDEVIKSDVRILALRDFIFREYVEYRKTHPYSTSFSCYSLYTTREECLMSDAIAAISDEEYPNYLALVPNIVYAILESHATKESQRSAAILFLQDFISDYVVSNLRETNELEEDED
jgi:hypothetical protein